MWQTQREKELEILMVFLGFFLSKCMSAQEKRTSDAAQLLVTTDEQLIMSQLKCQALSLIGHCSVVLMGLDMILQGFQGLNDNWIDYFF